ncbi:hypothetical protein ACF07L_20015 [Streptomyces anulatus]|uniref:hypothetical protein n=1 Tax=Streptomyces anulatus TaxID=1892 RepID=UPI0036FBA669
MLDSISMAAITAVLGAVGSGVASEAGKWAWETAGGLVRRMAGREVAAPTRPEERDAVARIIHDSVRSDPELARTWGTFARTVQTTGATIGRPRLPASVRFFTDRKGAMKLLDREAGRKAGGRPRVALLYGDDSMGTSALAVHWGWRAESLFPDGQLYVDLGRRGTGSAHAAGSALRELLLRLGLRDERIPPSETERIDAFHCVVADRRLLLVLDHARSAAQIAPLLTSAPSVLTMVVARRPLSGLDAFPVPVGPLADRDEARLLTKIVGKQVMRSARAALPAVLARCGGSPYALRAAAPRLLDPGPLTAAALPHHEPTGGLTMSDSDPVRTAAEDAYRPLRPDAARLYRLMDCGTGPPSTRRRGSRASTSTPPRNCSAAWPTHCCWSTRATGATATGRPYAPTPRKRRTATRDQFSSGSISARPARLARSSQALIWPGPRPCQMFGWRTAATRYSSAGSSDASRGSSAGSVSSPPPPSPAVPSPSPSPSSDWGLQVELSSTSRCPRPTPSALRNRSRYGRAASIRSKQGSPASTAVGSASGQAAASRSKCSGWERTSASARGTPSASSQSGASPKTGEAHSAGSPR